jgi:hypothetical protein
MLLTKPLFFSTLVSVPPVALHNFLSLAKPRALAMLSVVSLHDFEVEWKRFRVGFECCALHAG